MRVREFSNNVKRYYAYDIEKNVKMEKNVERIFFIVECIAFLIIVGSVIVIMTMT